MKTDLATAIITAIVGVVIAYFVTNILIPPVEDFSYTSVDSSIGADYDTPDVELFNFRALNPTVEVYVGNCTEYDERGECLDDSIIDEEDAEVPDDNDEIVNSDDVSPNDVSPDGISPNLIPEE
jgi:hypothetical protein